jgi:hypothetical protein
VARKASEYSRQLEAARKLEPKAALALRKSFVRLQEKVGYVELAAVIQSRNANRAVRLITEAMIDDAMSPVATVIRDAVLEGGRIGAEVINEKIAEKEAKDA